SGRWTRPGAGCRRSCAPPSCRRPRGSSSSGSSAGSWSGNLGGVLDRRRAAGQDLLHAPALPLGERPRLDDADGVALLRALLVVGHEGRGAPDGLVVDRVLHEPLHRHHHALLHLGRDHHADLLVAAAGARSLGLLLVRAHLLASAPCVRARSMSCCRMMVFTRAMSRRVSRILPASSSCPIDFWNRRRKSCSCSSRSLLRSSSGLISRIFSAFIWVFRPRYASSSSSASPGVWSERSDDPLARLHAVEARSNPGSAVGKASLRASRRDLHLEALDELRLDRELVGGQAQRVARVLLRHAFHLVEDAARLHHRHPLLGRALALAHAGLLRLLGDGLVGEEPDPDPAVPLDEAGDGDAAGLDLAVRDPAALQGLQAVVPEGDLAARPGLALHAAPLLLPELDLLRHHHL